VLGLARATLAAVSAATSRKRARVISFAALSLCRRIRRAYGAPRLSLLVVAVAQKAR
jgi:hypothetical protein